MNNKLTITEQISVLWAAVEKHCPLLNKTCNDCLKKELSAELLIKKWELESVK